MTASLPDLPAEILDRIAQYVGFRYDIYLRYHYPELCTPFSDYLARKYGFRNGLDLRNLRLTCRALEEKTRSQFRLINFQTIAIDISPAGFDKLDGICQHFYLKHHVSALRLDPKFYISVPKRKEPKEKSRIDAAAEPDTDPIAESATTTTTAEPETDSTSDTETEPTPSELALEEETGEIPGGSDIGTGYFDKAVLNLIYRGRMARRLRRSIANLPKLIMLHINPPSACRSWNMLPEPGRRYRSAIACMIKATLDVMCRAPVKTSDFRIFTKNNFNDWRCTPGMTSLFPLAAKTELLDQITSIHLEIDIEDDAGSALVKILQNTKNLSNLHLGFDRSEFSGRMLRKLTKNIDSICFSNVHRLSLCKMSTVPSTDLVVFLENFEPHCFELRLGYFDLEPGTWAEIFHFLSEHRPLAKLDLYNLYESGSPLLFEVSNAKIGHVIGGETTQPWYRLLLDERYDGKLSSLLQEVAQLYTLQY